MSSDIENINKYLQIVSNIENMHPSEHLILSGKHKLIRSINKLILEIAGLSKIIVEEKELLISMLSTLNRILEHIDTDTDFVDIIQEISDSFDEMNSKIANMDTYKIITNVPETFEKIYLRKSSILANEAAEKCLKQEKTNLVPYFVTLSYLLLLLSC